MNKISEIPALCEELYGPNWLDQFKRIETVGSDIILSPLVAEFGVAEASRLLPGVMAYLKQVCRGESVVLPNPVMSRLKRPSARLNEKIAIDLQNLNELEQCFRNALSKADLRDVDDVLALVLFSAMRFGGCLNAGKLHALMMALRDPPERHRNHYWFELEHESGVGQIWRPDPLTLVLLVSWYTNELHCRWATELPLAPNPHRVLARFFRKHRVWARHGISINRLLDAVSAKLSLETSPVLADCARGVIDNRTLSPMAYRRYITGKAPKLSHSHSEQRASPESSGKQLLGSVVHNALCDGDPQTDNRFWAHVRRILRLETKRPSARDQIEKQLKASQRALSPISRLLAEWVIHLLTTNNQWGNRLKPSSVGLDVSSILNGLRSSIGNSNCLCFLSSEWGEIYLQLLDAKESLGARRTAQKSLSEFHRFLIDNYGVNGTDGVDLAVGGNKGLPHVDANILLENEYRAAYRYIEDQRLRSKDNGAWEVATSQLVALILGFRGGLRRSEVYWLRINDIELGSQAQILLAGKRPVTLKSNAANRRIPLYVLLKPWELSAIKDWIHWKLDSGNANNSPLFSTESPQRLLIPSSDIFDPLQSVLQVITGDPQTRFHHLRHSFGTHLFSAWMCPESVEVSSREWVHRQRQEIFNARSGTAESKKIAKALHVMIGHASVGMSLTHYVHSVEWVLFERLSSISPRLSAAELSHLAGLTERQIQRLSKDSEMSAVALQGYAYRKLSGIASEIDISNWCAPQDKRIQIRSRKKVRDREWILGLWQALLIYQHRASPIDELAESFNVRPEEIERSLLRAKQISSMRYGNAGHNYYRHRPTSRADLEPEFFIFNFPAKERDMRSALAVVRRFEGLRERQKRVARWAIQYFLNHGSAGRAQITFREKTPLKKFIRALEILEVHATVCSEDGIKRIPRFRLKLVMLSDLESEDRKAAWEFWRSGCPLYSFQMKDKVAAARGQMGCIELSVLAFKGITPGRTNTKRKHSRPSDWGFRLGLYLLAIAYGWDDEHMLG